MGIRLPMDRNQIKRIREVFLILRAWGHLTSMTRLQWMVLSATAVVPVLVFPTLPYSVTLGPFDLPEFLPLWKTDARFDILIKHIVYGLWLLFVVILGPKAFREDRARLEQTVDLRLEDPKRDIQRLEGELEQSKSDLQEQKEQLADMDRVMRDGFDKVGVALPPHKIRLRLSATSGAPQARFTLNVSGGSRLTRWVKLPVRRFWKWFWG